MTAKPTHGAGITGASSWSRITGISALSFSRQYLSPALGRSSPCILPTRQTVSDGNVRVVRVLVSVIPEVLEVQVIEMVEIKCHNCGHEWDYTGERSDGQLVTCPFCYYKTRNSAETETTEA